MGELLKEIQASIKYGCVVQEFIDAMADDDRRDLTKAMSSDYPSKRIWEVLVKRGATYSVSQFQRHRRRDCSCGPV